MEVDRAEWAGKSMNSLGATGANRIPLKLYVESPRGATQGPPSDAPHTWDKHSLLQRPVFTLSTVYGHHGTQVYSRELLTEHREML